MVELTPYLSQIQCHVIWQKYLNQKINKFNSIYFYFFIVYKWQIYLTASNFSTIFITVDRFYSVKLTIVYVCIVFLIFNFE